MDTTLVLAKVFAIYFVVSGLFLIFKGKSLPLILKDFYDHPAVGYLTGTILLFLGLLLVLQNNIWDGSWRMLVTVFGWLALGKGLAYLFFPKFLSDIPVRRLRSLMVVSGVVLVAAGGYLLNVIW